MRALVFVGVGDECGDHDGETVDSGVAYRGAALLAVDDPAGLVFICKVAAGRNHERARACITGRRSAGQGFELDSLVERHHQSVWDHRGFGFQVTADGGDVRKYLGPLVALDLGVAVAANP